MVFDTMSSRTGSGNDCAYAQMNTPSSIEKNNKPAGECSPSPPSSSHSLNAQFESIGDGDTIANLSSRTECSYLRPLRTSGNRPPLICFFPGPPGAGDLTAALPSDQPVYEIWWPNVDDQVHYPTVEQLADLFLSEIRKLQPQGPYQFCGYSTFGLVAYEMGRRLIAEGQDVSFLALFDIWHPQFLDTLTGMERARYKALRVIDRIGKYRRVLKAGGVSKMMSHLAEFAINKARSVGWRLTQAGFRLAGRPIPKGMQTVASIAANKTYVPRPYPRRFILIRTEDLLDRKLNDCTVGWGVCAPLGIDLYFIDGDHGTIKDEPFVRGLVEKIAPHLAAAPIPSTHSTP